MTLRSTRRNVIKGSMAFAGLAAIGSAARAAEAGRPPAIFVFDARFAASLMLAESWQAHGVPVLGPREHDLGLAWRDHIPVLLAGGGTVAGATLWTDRWLCETLGRGHGLAPVARDLALPGDPGGALRQWALE